MTENENITQGYSWYTLIKKSLNALNWRGSQQSLDAILPMDKEQINLEEFRHIMAQLGFNTKIQNINFYKLTDELTPAIWIGKKHAYFIGSLGDCNLPDKRVKLLTFEAFEVDPEQDLNLKHIFHRFAPLLRQVMLFSLFIGLMGLAPTLFNMAVYDYVIASGSIDSLSMLLSGVLLALLTEVVLRYYRTRRLSYFGARVDHYVSYSVFERLLFLPPPLTERSDTSSQLARLKDFESVKDFFTGSLASILFELPLVFMYMVVFAILAGWLVFIPLVLLLVYVVLFYALRPILKRYTRQVANAITRRQDFILETAYQMPAIRLAGLDHVWQQRYREISAKASLASFRVSFYAQLLEGISYIPMTLASVATLSLGVMLVMDEQLSVGALIALMILIWRIVAPLQICCASVTRFSQLFSSVEQINRLMKVPFEHNPVQAVHSIRLKGNIQFKRVTLRYNPTSDPALLGVSFEIQQGQVIAIKGNNGSGKSSILKLIMGMYQPQGGSIYIDGIDIRQYDNLALRQAIAYVPQDAHFFPFSIYENLLFSNPSATKDQCIQALKKACAWDEINLLPDKMDTVMVGEGAAGISFLLKHRVNLARAYLRPSRLLLFDEASHSLGIENDKAFKVMIDQLRGESTIIIATHREDHMELADQLIVLEKGEILAVGNPKDVLKHR